jgi:hypothetical protein
MARRADVIICANIEASSKKVVDRPSVAVRPLTPIIAVSTVMFADLNPTNPTVEAKFMQ